MSFSAVWYLAAILVIGLIGWIANSPAMKGRIGEARLRRELETVLDTDTFSFLHDLTLPDYDGTCQIDHVLVSPFGVFVIETKNYNGWIFGSERQPTWTHVFHRRKYRFQNPLRQNYNHVKAVQAVSNLRSNQIHSLVVFAGKGEFRTPMPENVVKIHNLRRYFFARSDVVLAPQEMTEVVEQIEAKRLKPGLRTNRRHRQHIREVIQTPRCPRCEKRMVRRTARKGANSGKEFWGCTSYPKCKGVRPI